MVSRRFGLVVVAALLGLSACHASADRSAGGATQPSPFQSCPVAAASVAANTVTSITLPCFTGGQSVVLPALGQPAVINVWSSSCGPCREELPELDRFARTARGQVVVIGVITGDTRTAAAALARDLDVSFPAVFDPEMAFLRGMGRSAIPVTFFVDSAGHIRYTDVSGALTLTTLTTLAKTQLGVSVP